MGMPGRVAKEADAHKRSREQAHGPVRVSEDGYAHDHGHDQSSGSGYEQAHVRFGEDYEGDPHMHEGYEQSLRACYEGRGGDDGPFRLVAEPVAVTVAVLRIHHTKHRVAKH